MAIKFISVKCPECGATLDVEEGRQQLFCSYCGTKVMVQNDNEFIYRHIDEAKLKQAETDRMVELRRLEMAEKKRVERQKIKKLKIVISIILGIVGLLAFAVGFSSSGPDEAGIVGMVAFTILMYMWLIGINEDADDDDSDGRVKVPSGISEYEKKNYIAVKAILKGAGFTNISCIPLNDLTTGLLKKPDMVESITINGKSVTSGGKKFSSNATVVISYHSYARR